MEAQMWLEVFILFYLFYFLYFIADLNVNAIMYLLYSQANNQQLIGTLRMALLQHIFKPINYPNQ